MANIKENIVEVIGRTPLVRLNSLSSKLPGNIAAKLEFQNPMCSIKDRAAHAMIETAEMTGQLKKGATVIEATQATLELHSPSFVLQKATPSSSPCSEYASSEKDKCWKTYKKFF